MVTTRFAPSPTGYLHIGGARTALYCWLYAQKMGGKFVLRIEDTDLERSTDASKAAILDGMNWLGLAYEGEPIYQTQRMDRYKAVIEQLLAEGKAYRCYCSKERLQTLREEQQARKEKPRYDGRCRDLKELDAGPYVVRFANPKEGVVAFEDAVRGWVSVQNSELDDLIIARTDGSPTYNFTVVIDDGDMGITHVLRGDDHISNTPRQLNIFKALGITPPVYAHMPMILGEDGKRLSKRHGAVSVMQYRDEGFLPEALLNYLVRLGWSHGDQEIFSREEMITHFSLEHLSHSPAAFSQDKLLWLNQHYLKTLPIVTLVSHLEFHLAKQGVNVKIEPALEAVVAVQKERVKTLVELAEQCRYFYEPVTNYDEKAVKKHINPQALTVLATARDALAGLKTWEKETLHEVVTDIVSEQGLKFPKVAQPLRIALTGSTSSPSIDITLYLMGQAAVLARLEQALIKFNVENT